MEDEERLKDQGAPLRIERNNKAKAKQKNENTLHALRTKQAFQNIEETKTIHSSSKKGQKEEGMQKNTTTNVIPSQKGR